MVIVPERCWRVGDKMFTTYAEARSFASVASKCEQHRIICDLIDWALKSGCPAGEVVQALKEQFVIKPKVSK